MTIVSISLKALLAERLENRKRTTMLQSENDRLEAENAKLRQQRDAANAQIQLLNSIIAGDIV